MDITCGVPQNSILFNLYTRKHNVEFDSYADDTWLYVSVSPD